MALKVIAQIITLMSFKSHKLLFQLILLYRDEQSDWGSTFFEKNVAKTGARRFLFLSSHLNQFIQNWGASGIPLEISSWFISDQCDTPDINNLSAGFIEDLDVVIAEQYLHAFYGVFVTPIQVQMEHTSHFHFEHYSILIV